MTMLDLHPDELLDRARRHVTLTASETERLQAHLAGCAVCRFVQQAARDFDDEIASDAGGALASDGTQVELPLSLAEVIVSGRAGVSRRQGRAGRWSRSSRASRAVVAAGLVLGAGAAAAAAAQWAGILHLDRRSEPAAALVRAREPRTGGHSRGAVALDAPAQDMVAGSVDDESAQEERAGDLSWALARPAKAPDPAPSVDRIAGREPASGLGGRARRESPASVEEVAGRWSNPASAAPPEVPVPAPVSVAKAPPAPNAAISTATALFEEANGARRSGNRQRAQALYERLVGQFDGTPEAHAARAIVGRLLLDDGQPSAALRNFDEYLAGGRGDLQEEVMVGRARSLAQLNRLEQERATWIALLRVFPHSAYAGPARARIERLSKP